MSSSATNPELVAQFQIDLKTLGSVRFLREKLLQGECIKISSNQYVNIKKSVADHFNAVEDKIFIIGSAKLGFTLKPGDRYREFGSKSDIDVAVVCESKFTEIWKEVYLYIKSGAYWPKSDEFKKYLAMGWIRPDKLPPSEFFKYARDWWEHFRQMTQAEIGGRHKITGALYHSKFFLEQYQLNLLSQLELELTQ